MKIGLPSARTLAIASVILGALAFSVCVVQATCFRLPRVTFVVVKQGQSEPESAPEIENGWAENYFALPARYILFLAVLMALVSFFDSQKGKGLHIVALLVNVLLLIEAIDLIISQGPSL